MNSLSKSLKFQMKKYIQVLEDIKKLWNPNQKDFLKCETHRNHFEYYRIPEGYEKSKRGIYLKKSQLGIAKDIARQDYYKKLIPLLEERIKMIKKIISMQESDQLEVLYSNMCDARKALIEPLFEPVEDVVERWLKEPYEKLPFDENDKSEIYSDRGERMRSKSEKIFADRFLARDVPYKYEYPVELEDWGRIVIYHPDFVIFKKSTRKVVFHEHLGMMDDSSYAERCVHKIHVYEKNSYLLGRDLFITMETQNEPLTTRLIDEYIDVHFT